MGNKMTYKQAKEILKAYNASFTGYAGNLQDAIDTMLVIAEKYEKIEQIHKQWFCDFDSATAYSRISEVLKDG